MNVYRTTAAALLLSGAATAHAAGGSCVLNSGTQLINFGNYTAASADVKTSALVLFTCVPSLGYLSVSYSMSISAGNSSSFATRKMTAGGYSLNYNLYADSAYTMIWGDGTSGTSTRTGNCATLCSQTVYGKLIGGQAVPAAIYQDSVTITLNF
jgi:spore coat protein U-like protein